MGTDGVISCHTAAIGRTMMKAQLFKELIISVHLYIRVRLHICSAVSDYGWEDSKRTKFAVDENSFLLFSAALYCLNIAL